MSEYVNAGAALSACGTYRYRLWREWRGAASSANWVWLEGEDGAIARDGTGDEIGGPKSVVFIMLNPSTADGAQDDPTIRRCVGFAKSWGFDRMEVVNLFAFRATQPRELLALKHYDEPWGIDNRLYIDRLLDGDIDEEVGLIVCAWGAHGKHLGQDEVVLGWLTSHWNIGDIPITALRLTQDGSPCHPLYLPADLRPVRFERAYA